MSRSFSSIRNNSQFFDCTLTTDDDEAYSDNLRAHKVILSACSKFFKNILTKESMCAHPNPLIYLKGISAKELRYILDFMYHGEVNVAKYELDKFLEVADTLKIKGLTTSTKKSQGSDRPGFYTTNPSPSPGSGEPCKKLKVLSAMTQSTPISMSESKIVVKTECDPLVPIGIGDLEEGIRCSDNDGDGSNNEDYDNDFEGEYGGIDGNDDLEIGEALKNKCPTQSSNETRANKRLASATSPSSSADEPTKKIKVQNAVTQSPTTTDTVKSKCGTLVAVGSEDLEESFEGNHDYDDNVKDHMDKIEDEYEVDNDGVVVSHKSTRGDDESGGSGSGVNCKTKPCNPKGFKHITETERITLVNLIKTLDKDQLLMGDGSKQRSPEAKEKRKVLWYRILSAFNEICGRNCDAQKLKNALNRIKRNSVITKAHSLLYDEYEDR